MLGEILKGNATKKIALKLEKISGLTNMSYCFYGCEILVQAPEIPTGVTNMEECFYGCKNLKSAVLKCKYSIHFTNTFTLCEKLSTGSIKVPAGELSIYKAEASSMGTTEDTFAAGE